MMAIAASIVSMPIAVSIKNLQGHACTSTCCIFCHSSMSRHTMRRWGSQDSRTVRIVGAHLDKSKLANLTDGQSATDKLVALRLTVLMPRS